MKNYADPNLRYHVAAQLHQQRFGMYDDLGGSHIASPRDNRVTTDPLNVERLLHEATMRVAEMAGKVSNVNPDQISLNELRGLQTEILDLNGYFVRSFHTDSGKFDSRGLPYQRAGAGRVEPEYVPGKGRLGPRDKRIIVLSRNIHGLMRARLSNELPLPTALEFDAELQRSQSDRDTDAINVYGSALQLIGKGLMSEVVEAD